ncbi:MAG: hypothetical protein QXT73_01375, partial [Candidatus Methanomethylicaceae archaeon]
LATRPIEGVWDKEYSIVPIGELEGRRESEAIPQKTMTMGFTTYGAIAIEASGKVGLSKLLKQRSRDFTSASGEVNEAKFSGYLADTVARGFLLRRAQRWNKLCAQIFNYGAIPTGHTFFNHYKRCLFSDVPNSDYIYDERPLFAYPSAPHYSYATNSTRGNGARAVGNFVDAACTVPDTGGYFNRFDYPPSYWALKRVWTHFCNNMQFDDNDERYVLRPDTLLVSEYDLIRWTEILRSKFIEPFVSGQETNRENVFLFEGFKLRLVSSPLLIPHTWFLGKAKSQGILLLKPTKEEDPWAYWRDENDRSYWISFEDEWGFMIRNWRFWCAGAASSDGENPPTFGGLAESSWDTMPAGV